MKLVHSLGYAYYISLGAPPRLHPLGAVLAGTVSLEHKLLKSLTLSEEGFQKSNGIQSQICQCYAAYFNEFGADIIN